MKILFVAPYYKPYLGGIERVIEQMSLRFQSLYGAQTYVLTTKWSFPRVYQPKWAKQEIIEGNHIYRLNSFPGVAPSVFQVPLVWFSPVEIKKYLESVKPDVIQLMSDRWFWTNYWIIFWAKRMKIPVSFALTFHSLTKLQRWLIPLNMYLTNTCDAVEVVTNLEKQKVQSTYKTQPDLIKVIPWGITKPLPTTRKLPHMGTEVTILCVGRISEHKGQLWLAQRYQQANFTHNTHLVLVGGIENEKYKERISKLTFSGDKRLTITGEVSEDALFEYYNSSDIFALYPEYEAFGLVFLEALSRGIPVASHNVGTLSEVLSAGSMLAKAYDSSEVVSNIETLVNDPYKRKTLGTRGKTYVLEHFTWEKTVEQFMQLYTSLL